MPKDRRHSIDIAIHSDAWETIDYTAVHGNLSKDSFWENFFHKILNKTMQTQGSDTTYINVPNRFHALDSTIRGDRPHKTDACMNKYMRTGAPEIVEDESVKGEGYSLSVLLTDNIESQQLNRDFRAKDKPTNVLSFPAPKMPDHTASFQEDPKFLGDLAFAYGVIYDEAVQDDKIFLNHMTHLTIHGILHLLGYDHETESDAQTMEALEIRILADFNIRNPYL